MNAARPVIFIMGPTAAGKTRLAMRLSESLPVRIISVDSAMVYRGMDIGTGKPGPEALRRVPHRLIDIRDPDETYSAADFRIDALEEIDRAHAEDRVACLVGGTGLYFRALREGLSDLPAADPAVRAQLVEDAAAHGWQALHERLAEVDPASARRIHSTDPQRIQRALEVYRLTGRPMSQLLSAGERAPLPNPVLAVVIEPQDRRRLHADITTRFASMLDAGLVDEVRALETRWCLSADSPAMRAVGYRQVLDFLQDRSSAEEMRRRAIAATRQLARRQLTWLRAERGAERFDCYAPNLARSVLESLRRGLGGAS